MQALKISAVINSATPPAWIVQTLVSIHEQDHLSLERIILQEQSDAELVGDGPSQSLPYRVGRKLLYGYINRPRFSTGALEPTDLCNGLSGLLQHPANNKNRAADGELTDVILHFGDMAADLPMQMEATIGTWIVEHEKLTQHIEQSLLQRHPLLWVHLWNASKKTDQHTLIASHALPMQSFSISDLIQSGFGCLPMLILSRLNWTAHGLDAEKFEFRQVSESIRSLQTSTQQHQTKPLAPTTYLTHALRLLVSQTKQRVRDKTHIEQWQLGFLTNNQHATECEVNDFVELNPPKNTVWADPHALVVDEQTHVFLEVLNIDENKGRIATATLTSSGFTAEPVTVLDEPHHLSYPSVFAHQNDYYMIPETASNKAVSLYKARHFPDQWEPVRTLIADVDYADSTLFFHNELWWMFTNGISHEAVDERDTLLLFYCKDFLTDDWQAHPLNPVVTGVDRARMAGPIYEKAGVLYRPSQYGAIRYGFGINAAQILRLDTEQYEETLISRTTPTDQDRWMGCHTALHNDALTIVDRLTRVRK